MTISAARALCGYHDDVFTTAMEVIDRSGVATEIEAWYQQRVRGRGQQPAGIAYTVEAVLVAFLVRNLTGRPFSIGGAMVTIAELTDAQRAAVGMAGQDCTAIITNPRREYARLHRFWNARMSAIDPDLDLPARRMTNAAFAVMAKSRTPEQLIAAQLADERLTTVINRLLAASINDQAPSQCHGDVVVDETLINTATPDGKIGVHPDRYRAASTLASYWRRDKLGITRPMQKATTPGNNNHKGRTGKKPAPLSAHGFGFGATFVSRVGHRDALHAVPALFIGMDVHAPTGANTKGLQTALVHAQRNGLDARRSGQRRAWPLLTADMGYNPKKDFAELMIRMRYSPVVRYPKGWTLRHPSAAKPGGPRLPLPGPVQYAGSFFSPAVGERLAGHGTPGTRELGDTHDGFRKHDERLRAIYPFLMGHHTRPEIVDVRSGRPTLDEQAPKAVRIRLVCPAALGSVRCPLKPESMTIDRPGLPTAEPNPGTGELACCSNLSTSVYLTKAQLRMAQWDLIPGSWEHTLYFEAARSLTEQRFSQLKSRYVGALADLKTGPRRTPMLKLAVALAAVTVNIAAQQSHDPRAARTESIDIRWRQLARQLGREPVRIPPRS